GSYVLGSFNLAQQLLCITADTASVDFNDLDLAFRVDYKSTTVSQTCFFNHYAEVAGDSAGWVANHRVVDFADGWGGVVPCFVAEVGVGGNCVDFNAQLLELCVAVGQVFQLGWAYEGEVCRVEEYYGPFAFQVSFAHVDEITFVEGGGFEWFYFAVDVRHYLKLHWWVETVRWLY